MDNYFKNTTTVNNHNSINFIENKWHKIGINIVYTIGASILIFNYFMDKINLELILIFSSLLVTEEISKYEITRKNKYIITTIIYLIIAIVSLIEFIIIALK